MSVQLVLYPQIGVVPQLVGDSINFISVGTTTAPPSQTVLTGSQTSTYALGNSAATSNWKKFNYTGETTPHVTVSNGVTRLTLIGQNSVSRQTGVYQKISNLIIGAPYLLTLNVYGTVPPFANLQMGSVGWSSAIMPTLGGGQVSTINITATGWTPAITFTPSATDETLCLVYTGAATQNLQIQEIRIEELAPYESLGQEIVDLYEEEEIPLTLSVDDFKNVAEKVQSYSKDFNLPATKRNNKIFDNIFEITRTDNGLVFNPYIQTKAILKENGFTVFQGFLKLLEIKNQKGEISYNVNLYSEAIALADILKNRKFSELDFSELNNEYKRTNINASWSGALPLVNPLPSGTFAGAVGATTTGVLKYPFVDWTGSLNRVPLATQSSSASTSLPTINKLEDVFRPWIQLKYLINRIFSAVGFTWTSNFFDSANFGRLFMDFNWGGDETPSAWSEGGVAYQSGSQAAGTPNFNAGGSGTELSFTGSISPNGILSPANAATSGFNGVGGFTAPLNNFTYSINYRVWIQTTSNCTFEFRWHTSTGVTFGLITWDENVAPAAHEFTGTFSVTLQAGDTLTAEMSCDTAGAAYFDDSGIGVHNVFNCQISTGFITTGSLLNTLRGDLGQWDFLKGIITMFNLVTLQDETNPTNLIIEPYDDVFINNTSSVIHDWTHKVDVSQIQLKPLDLKASTSFQYEEDKDYPFEVYKNATQQYLYGSKEITVSKYTMLEGQEKIEAKPFSATIMKAVFDDISTFISPAIYSGNEDETEFEGIDNKPRILYDVLDTSLYDITPTTYFIPAQNGDSGANENTYAMFSHTSTIPSISSANDFNFGGCQLINIGVSPVNNLYNTYYSNYYDELYHSDTRILTIKVLLSPADITNFKFYDKVRIKNSIYRCNKINYKPKDLSSVEFILIP